MKNKLRKISGVMSPRHIEVVHGGTRRAHALQFEFHREVNLAHLREVARQSRFTARTTERPHGSMVTLTDTKRSASKGQLRIVLDHYPTVAGRRSGIAYFSVELPVIRENPAGNLTQSQLNRAVKFFKALSEA